MVIRQGLRLHPASPHLLHTFTTLKLDHPAAPEVPVADRRPVSENAMSLANDLAGRPRSPRYTATIDKEMPWAVETGTKGTER